MFGSNKIIKNIMSGQKPRIRKDLLSRNATKTPKKYIIYSGFRDRGGYYGGFNLNPKEVKRGTVTPAIFNGYKKVGDDIYLNPETRNTLIVDDSFEDIRSIKNFITGMFRSDK